MFFRSVVGFFFILFAINLLNNNINAQEGGVAPGETITTNPKIRNTIVTASVPDIISPSAPILISPTNGSFVNDATPTFVWQTSTDNVGVDHYEMYLDGILLYSNIPISSTSNSFYDLVYNSGLGQYSLTPNSNISDGNHTWSITAYDAAGNSNTSATWAFTIDTQAPSFIVTSIGPSATNISAQDIGSVPEDPIELEDNSPTFFGTGESYSTVRVTVSIPGESDQIVNFTVDGSNNWNFQLGILPRNEIITLNFVVTDLAGNISIITNLKIIIIQDFIVFPPTPTPISSIFPTPNPESSPEPSPIIKIPILPINEIFTKIANIFKKLIPESFASIVSQAPEIIKAVVLTISEKLAPTGAMVATLTIPVLGFLAAFLQLGQQLSWQLILKILQALGLLPPSEPQGIVYDSDSNEPVAFALLTITSVGTSKTQQLFETVVTDVNGIYQGVKLPKGKYQINVSQEDHKFPTDKQKPSYLTVQEFYKGEVFEVYSTEVQQLFLIPVDKLTEAHKNLSIKNTARNILRKFKLVNLFWPLFIISTIITIFFPTALNMIVLLFYVLLLIKKAVGSLKRPDVSGFVLNTNQSPIEHAVIRINDPTKGKLVTILSTDSNGYFSARLEPNKYQIQVSKNGFVWMREGSQLSLEEINITVERVTLNITMKDVNEIYKELFS